MRSFLLADATIADLDGIAAEFRKVMQYIVAPILSVIGVAAVAYIIVLGIQYAKAEDAEGRKKVQGRLIGACIGAVIIIAGIVLCLSINWSSILNGFQEKVDAGATISAFLR